MTQVNFSEVRPKVDEFLELADDLGFVIASRLDRGKRSCDNCNAYYSPQKVWQKFCSPQCKRASRWKAKKASREFDRARHRL